MESIRLFEEQREEDVLIEAPYVFSLKKKSYVPSKKTVTAATISVDGTVTEEKNETLQPNNEIWYTTTDGKVLEFSTYVEGDASVNLSTVLSNVYENGKGVVTFSEDITFIGYFEIDDETYFGLYFGQTPSDDSDEEELEQYYNDRKRLSSIILPSSVTSIGGSAFEKCYSLTSIEIPSSVTSIDSGAFSSCSGLTSVTFEEGSQLTSIGGSAFEKCYSLTSIEIPSSVTSIDSGAFSSCSGLTSVTFEEGSQLTSIGDSAFDNCYSLTSVIYKGITYTKKSALTSALEDDGVTVSFSAFGYTGLNP